MVPFLTVPSPLAPPLRRQVPALEPRLRAPRDRSRVPTTSMVPLVGSGSPVVALMRLMTPTLGTLMAPYILRAPPLTSRTPALTQATLLTVVAIWRVALLLVRQTP